MTLIWLGVIIAMNLQTSLLTPPFGFALFYLRSVVAKSDDQDRVTGQTRRSNSCRRSARALSARPRRRPRNARTR